MYVATQKETAAIIGKLLRMEFHHKLLSIEVVRKDTGGKEEGEESKKECKGVFHSYLSISCFGCCIDCIVHDTIISFEFRFNIVSFLKIMVNTFFNIMSIYYYSLYKFKIPKRLSFFFSPFLKP